MKKAVTLLALALALGPAGVASAQSVEDTYRGESNVLGQIGEARNGQPPRSQTAASQSTQAASKSTQAASQSVPAPATVQASSGSLPLTGAELAVLAAAGLALVGAGVGLRRLARNGSA